MRTMKRRDFLGLCGASVLLNYAEPGGAATSAACSSASTAEEVTKGLDLTGRTAIVTGCNSGMSFRGMIARNRQDDGVSPSRESAYTL